MVPSRKAVQTGEPEVAELIHSLGGEILVGFDDHVTFRVPTEEAAEKAVKAIRDNDWRACVRHHYHKGVGHLVTWYA